MKLPNAGILTLDAMCVGCGACHDDWRAWPSHEHRLSLDEARIWRDDALALSDAPYWRPAVHEVTQALAGLQTPRQASSWRLLTPRRARNA